MGGLETRVRRSVLTGGPGAGKSALLAALCGLGIDVEGEVARAILQQPGGMELRESNPSGFARAMFDAESESYRRAEKIPGPVIYDRGLPDVVGFLNLEGIPVPGDIDAACRERRYDGPVFHARPWREIYRQDEERTQDWDDALASDRAVCDAWRYYGYELVELPFVPVEQRAEFVIERLG